MAERHRPGRVGGDEAAEPVAAGDQGGAVVAARQQGPDLLGGARVVEDDEQSAAGGQGAEQGTARLDGLGDPLRLDSEREQEFAEDSRRSRGPGCC